MKTKKNVYIVFTEYQLLHAVNLAFSNYNDDCYENIIFVIRNGRRLNGMIKQRYTYNNTVLQCIDHNSPKNICERVLEEDPNHFFFFQGTSPLTLFLGYTFSRQGVEITLGPDGYSAYAIFNKRYKFLSQLKDTYYQNKFLFNNKLLTGKIHVYNYTYGYHKFINNLLLTHPEEYRHRSNNKVNILKLPLFSHQSLKFIKEIFNYQDDFPVRDAIYFFNQPMLPELQDLEHNFLLDVQRKFPDRHIILKLHPLTTDEMKQKYSSMDNISLIKLDFPAELILLSLRNCIVYSGWSTVLITYNNTCNYYFNYPLFKKRGHRNLDQFEIPALSHIKMVESVEDMEFPEQFVSEF